MLRLFGWLFGFGMFCVLAGVGVAAIYLNQVSAGLPDYTVLKDYQPPVTTRVHAADGSLLAEYAHERRLFQPIETVPPTLLHAFISAEDKDFYSHHGIAFDGVVRALRDNIMARLGGSDAIQGGGSTITQQVAKNFLLTSEQTWDRKIQEAILALRIDSTFTKDKILELYVNEIFLGLNSYGVAAAALNYFDKALYQLDLSEMAYIAGLPKGPNNYHPFKHPEAAIERRNYVLDRMAENGYITGAERDKAKAESLNVVPRQSGSQLYSAEYFTEEVRRQLAGLYGEDQLYGGGLSVRTTLEPKLQEYARKALMDGLIDYDHNKGFRGPVASIDVSGDWGPAVAAIKPLGRCAGMDAGGGPRHGQEPGNHRTAAIQRHRGQAAAGSRQGNARRPRYQMGQQEAVRYPQGRRRGVRVAGSRPGRVIYAAAGARDRGLAGSDGPAYRPRAGVGRRLFLFGIGVQPGHAGAAPAGVVVQADRLFGGAGQWLHACVRGAGRAC